MVSAYMVRQVTLDIRGLQVILVTQVLLVWDLQAIKAILVTQEQHDQCRIRFLNTTVSSTVTANTFNVVTFSNIVTDTASCYIKITGGYTIPMSANYDISDSCHLAVQEVDVVMSIFNGSSQLLRSNEGNLLTSGVSGILYLTTGEVITPEIRILKWYYDCRIRIV